MLTKSLAVGFATTLALTTSGTLLNSVQSGSALTITENTSADGIGFNIFWTISDYGYRSPLEQYHV